MRVFLYFLAFLAAVQNKWDWAFFFVIVGWYFFGDRRGRA